MADIHVLETVTTLDLPTERVLESAKEHLPEIAVVVGYDHAGELYVASSITDVSEALLLLERAKMEILSL